MKKAIKLKHTMWNRYQKKRSTSLEEYTRQRNVVTTLGRQAKRSFETKLANEDKENPNNFWKYIQSKMKTKSGIDCLKNDKDEMVLQKQMCLIRLLLQCLPQRISIMCRICLLALMRVKFSNFFLVVIFSHI